MKKYTFAFPALIIMLLGCQKEQLNENSLKIDGINSRKNSSTDKIDLTRNLLAFYPFNGNANDATINGNHGTVVGATLTSDRFNKKNQAYLFNGIDNYIRCIKAGPTGNPVVSISFWMKANATQISSIIGWGNDGSCGNDFRLLLNTIKKTIDFDTYENVVEHYNENIGTGKWEHYVLTYDGVLGANVFSSAIYRNGVLITSFRKEQNWCPTNVLDLQPITIGRYHGTVQTNFFNGALDDFRVYTRILNSSEIKYLATH